MIDLQEAMDALHGRSLALCKGDSLLLDSGRGLSGMMRFLAEGRDLRGYCAADLVVGKAAAMLFVKAGIRAVFAVSMSEAGKAYLDRFGIPNRCETLVPHIMNCAGDNICPMEQAVADIDDADSGYEALRAQIEKMRSQPPQA